MANFVEGKLGELVIKYGRDFTERALDLIVPHNGNSAQYAVILEAVEYAKIKGVKLNIIIEPKR